jgi:hypothetical protein
MGYTTPEELKRAAGSLRLDQAMPPNQKNRTQFLSDLIDAGAGEMDAYLGTLYETPINTDALEGDERDHVLALLSRINIALAMVHIPMGAKDAPPYVKSEAEWARRTLSTLRTGRRKLGSIEPKPKEQFAMTDEDTSDIPLPDSLYITNRTVY